MSAERPGRLRRALSRLGALSTKELIQLRRDRLTLAMMVALPAVQLLLFGYAINTDVRHVPAVVYDQDRSAASRDFAQRLQATGFYDLQGEVGSYAEISRALRGGEAKAALVVPPRWSSDVAAGRRRTVTVAVPESTVTVTVSAVYPNNRTDTVYRPAGTPVILKLPLSRVVAVHFVPTSVTAAPPTPFPVAESRMRPDSAPVAWVAPAPRSVITRADPYVTAPNRVPLSTSASASSTLMPVALSVTRGRLATMRSK